MSVKGKMLRALSGFLKEARILRAEDVGTDFRRIVLGGEGLLSLIEAVGDDLVPKAGPVVDWLLDRGGLDGLVNASLNGYPRLASAVEYGECKKARHTDGRGNPL